MLEMIKNLLRSKPIEEASAYVERARLALTRAEAEASSAGEQELERAGELATIEAAYDADPSDSAGGRVIKARNARDLAKLRLERAQKRTAEAREALDAAEAELERVRAAEELKAARVRAAEAITAEISAGREVRSLLGEALRRADASGMAKAREERAAALEELAAIERKMELAADHAPTEARASWASAREAVAPAVALLLSAEGFAAQARSMASAALDVQRSASNIVGTDPFPSGMLEALLVRARFVELPDEERTASAADKAARTVIGLLIHGVADTGYNLHCPEHMSLEEWADELLEHPLAEARKIAAESAPKRFEPVNLLLSRGEEPAPTRPERHGYSKATGFAAPASDEPHASGEPS